MAPLADGWATVAGLRCRYVFGGSGGTPLVGVHGLGVSTSYLRRFLAAAARTRGVAAPDLPGFGRTERPESDLGVGELASFLCAWLDVVRPEPLVLFGNSLGCQVAVEAAIRRPDRVRALVLLGPTADARARSLPRQVTRLAVDSLREPLSLNLLAGYEYLVRGGPRRTFVTARRMLEHRIEERAPLVAAPVVVARGERDPIAPQEWVEVLADRFPLGRVVVISGAAHAAHWTHPERVAALVDGIVPEL